MLQLRREQLVDRLQIKLLMQLRRELLVLWLPMQLVVRLSMQQLEVGAAANAPAVRTPGGWQ